MQDPGSITYLLPAGFGVDRTDPAVTDLQLLCEPVWEDPDPISSVWVLLRAPSYPFPDCCFCGV